MELKEFKNNGKQESLTTTAYTNSPNIQTSLAVVNRLKLIDSGAIHLIGNRVTEAAVKYDGVSCFGINIYIDSFVSIVL